MTPKDMRGGNAAGDDSLLMNAAADRLAKTGVQTDADIAAALRERAALMAEAGRQLTHALEAKMPDEKWFEERYHLKCKVIEKQDAEIERLQSALEWYSERAKSLAEKDWKKNPSYAEAIFVELSLDGGRRAGINR